MKDNYSKFINAINSLKTDRAKENCYSLVRQAQIYYSAHLKMSGLKKSVANKFTHLFEFKEDNEGNGLKIFFKDANNRIDYSRLLGVWFFYEAMIILEGDSIGKRRFNFYLQNWEGELKRIESYNVNKRLKNHDMLIEWVGKSCKQFSEKASSVEQFQNKKYLYKTIETLREAVVDFNKFYNMKDESEKICFNEVFSDEYVEMLIRVMNSNEGLISLYIAPIRRQLSATSDGAEVDYVSWGFCYNKDFKPKRNLSVYYESIEKIKSYRPFLKTFQYFDEEVTSALERLKENKTNEDIETKRKLDSLNLPPSKRKEKNVVIKGARKNKINPK